MQRGVECGLSTPLRRPPPLLWPRERACAEGRTSRTASPQRGARSVRCCVLSPLLRRTTIAALDLLILEHERLVHTNADGRTLFVDSERNCSELGESALSDGGEPWLAQNRLRRAGGGTTPIGPETSSPLRERSEVMHHSASQCECDNILSWRPDRGKRVLVHPNVDGLGDRYFEIVSKMHGSVKSVVWAKMAHSCGPRTPNLAPFSLSVRESLSRPSAEQGGKNSHRSPALPRHSTSLHRGFQSWAGSTPPARFGNRAN